MKKQSLSKRLGISGIEARHIENAFNKSNIDIEVVDWKTVGEEAGDFGDSYGTIWDKLGKEYGISKPITNQKLNQDIHKYDNKRRQQRPAHTEGLQEELCLDRHLSRSRQARVVDEHTAAENIYKASNLEGVKKWMKNPNRYDIHGIDYFGKMKKKPIKRKKNRR